MKRFLNKEISFGYDLASEYRKKYPLSELDIKERKLLLLSQSEEMERLRAILHEQGRQIDELRLENSGQRKRIESLETCLEEEAARR